MQKENVGERIRVSRKMRGMRQTELAEAIGLTTAAAISSWEKGRNEPSLEKIVLLSSALHVSVLYLLGISEISQEAQGETHQSLSAEESLLLDAYRKLDDDSRQRLQMIAEKLSAAQTKSAG